MEKQETIFNNELDRLLSATQETERLTVKAIDLASRFSSPPPQKEENKKVDEEFDSLDYVQKIGYCSAKLSRNIDRLVGLVEFIDSL